MMKTVLLVLTLFMSFNVNGQDVRSSPFLDSIDGIITTLYSVISGEKGETRDWELMRSLFHPEAKLIPSGLEAEGEFKARYITPGEYIQNSGQWLINNGFFEKEIHRVTQRFGNIAHIFSTYECFHSETDNHPFMRGINSIQLLFDGKRWWIINLYWTQETVTNPIPGEYLPD